MARLLHTALISVVFLFSFVEAHSQDIDEFESSLPLVILQTDGREIQDENRIVIRMGIVNNGTDTRNRLDDPFNGYDGKVSIELRGESSQMFPKKSYSIETQDDDGNNRNVPLLGMPAENDWVLYAPYSDKTMMRNVLAYKMGNDLGQYAPRTRYVELFLNDQYQGVYVLVEKIKIDKNRVNLATLKPEDVSGNEVTGGYIMRVDKIDWNDYPAFAITPSPRIPGEGLVSYQYFDPKGLELQPAQRQYISDFLYQFESALSSPNFNKTREYRQFIDVNTFIDFMIVTEIGKNVDGYVYSTYMYKDKDSKDGRLKMGPLWDFNLAFGNVDYWANSQNAPGWMYNDSYRMYWFRRLMADDSFARRFKCRWKELRSTLLSNDYFTNTIDSIASMLQEPQQRNFQRWPVLGNYVWPNQFVGLTYESEVSFLKTWILNRLRWMDTNLRLSDCDIVTSNENESGSLLSVYPNPASNTFSITSETRITHGSILTITDTRGVKVISTSFTGHHIFDAASISLKAGLYFVNVVYLNGTVEMTKLIIL